MSTTNMYKYVHDEVYEAEKIAQPIAGTGFVDIVGSDGVTPIAFSAIDLFDDALGTTTLVIDVDYEVGSADSRYTALESSTVYRQVRIINAAYQSAVFYADFDAVGGYVQYNAYPVGSFYTQYPDVDSNTLATAFPDAYRPADMFGGTWVAQWDDEGIDFHTERASDTGLQTRTDGLQADQMQQITGALGRSSLNNVNWSRDTDYKGDGVFATSESGGTDSVQGQSGGDYLGCNPLFDSANSPDARTGTVTCDSNRLVRIWKRTA